MAHEALQGKVLLAQGAGDGALALLDGLLTTLLGEPRTYLVAGPGGGDEGEPVARGPGVDGLGGEDLHRVTVLQTRVQGHQSAVDACAHGAVANLGVDGVGEVHRGGSRRQCEDITPGGEDVDLVPGHLVAQGVEELGGVLGLLLPVDELTQPAHVALVGVSGPAPQGAGARGVGVLLVAPVRGHAVLGHAVHLVGADLNLHRLATRPDDSRVQRLVEVELGDGDVVLEAPAHGGPARVQGAEHRVAVLDGVDDDSQRHQVVDVVEVFPPHDHLLVDRVVVLGPSGHGALDLVDPQVLLDLESDLAQVLLTSRGPLGHHVLDLLVHARVEGFEGPVLQLPLDRVHPQTVGQGRVDLQGLLGLAGGVLRGDVLPGAGVVKAVAELDDQHPDVLGHRDNHLAHRLGLGGLTVLELVELGDAVDEQADLVAEVGAQTLEGVVGVLHGVVQDGSRQRLGRHSQLGQDGCHCHRVGDVGLPRLASLTGVSLLRHFVGAHDEARVGLGVVGAHRAQQRLDGRRCGVSPGAEPRQSAAHARAGDNTVT